MKLAIIILLILTINIVYASTIHGTLYDLSLDPIKNTIIEINSIPSQKLLSKDGSYLFQVPYGKYNITARTIKNEIIASEYFEVKTEGEFLIDLFAFPELSEESDLSEIESDLTIVDEKNYFIIPILIIILLAGISYYFYRKNKLSKNINEDELTEKVISIIKNSGNRTTQKEIRKALPYSEAKISLVIAELESKGKIEKIKKGRGNIIILKK